jgi:hypothetical protein
MGIGCVGAERIVPADGRKTSRLKSLPHRVHRHPSGVGLGRMVREVRQHPDDHELRVRIPAVAVN